MCRDGQTGVSVVVAASLRLDSCFRCACGYGRRKCVRFHVRPASNLSFERWSRTRWPAFLSARRARPFLWLDCLFPASGLVVQRVWTRAPCRVRPCAQTAFLAVCVCVISHADNFLLVLLLVLLLLPLPSVLCIMVRRRGTTSAAKSIISTITR